MCNYAARLGVLIFVFLISTAIAQESQHNAPITRPRPYFFTGMDLEGNGSTVLNYVVAAGVQENTAHFIFDGYAEYTNTRKTDDNTINNRKGRTRLLYAAPRYRLKNNWFAGIGARWNELSTTNYTKQSFRVFVGGGRDWTSTRLSADYLRTVNEHVNSQGCTVLHGQCTNAVQGIDIQWFMPSPASRSHFLFRMDFTPFWFHTTVTTTDPTLTRQQEGQVGVGSVLQYTLLVRY